MSDVQKFVAEWNARSAKGGFERYIAEQKAEAAEKATLKATAQGLKQGKKAGILQTAKNMIFKDISVNTISEVTGLSEKELNKLKKEIC